MARDEFVAVACDDWYQRRRQDAEGDFFRKLSGGGDGKGDGGSTRQGIYFITADGKRLGYKNAGQSPEAMRDEFHAALARWKDLPADERQPGAVTVPTPGK